MGGLKEIRSIFGLGGCEDHDVIDAVLDKISEQERCSEEKYLLSKGREVYRITLTKSVPTEVIKGKLNITFNHDVQLLRFNNLDSSDHQFTGAWLIRQGFIVRSKKENENWVKHTFKSSG